MPPKSKLKSEDVPAILSEQPMSTDLMIRVCELLTKFTHTKTICLEGILPKNMRFGRKRHICLLLNSQNRWICCFNDGRKTLTEYNTNEQTDTTELSTRLLRTYNIQPFELKQSIVKSDMPSPSSDADSGFVSVAIAAKVGTRKGSPPASVDPVAVRKGLLKMMYRGKLNGFPDYEEKKGCCGKSKMLPDELLFNNLFEAFETLNRNTQMPEECPATPVPPTTPRKARVSQPKVEIQEIQEEEEEEEEQRQMKDVKISEPKVELVDDFEGALSLPNFPVDGRRVVNYEKGPNSSSLSVSTTGVIEDKNIRYIQYEKITKEIHYIKPKSNKSK